MIRREAAGGRARRRGGGEHLRGDGGGGAPGAPDHPPHQARAPRCAHRGHRLRGADRAGATSRRCPRSIASSATRKNSTRASGPDRRADRRRRHHGGDAARRARGRSASKATPAPSCRCRTAATTAAPSALFRSGAAIRARCRWMRWWRRRGGFARNGYREIVLTGVDITSYGADLPGAPRLGALVKRMLKEIPELTRLRLSSIDSVEADDDLLDALGQRAAADAASASVAAGRRRSHPQAHEAAAFARRMPSHFAIKCAGCGPMWRSAPTSSPASRPRPRTCSRVRSIWWTNAASRSCTCFRFRRGPARRPRACRSSIAPSSRNAPSVCAKRARRRCARHLEAQVGARRLVLTERGGIGRTEQFTAVRLAAPVEPGTILDLTMAGHDGRQLLAA